MKTKYRQKNIGHCTVYLLANIFQDDNFLKFLKDDKYKACSSSEINEMLSNASYKNIEIADVYKINQGFGGLDQKTIMRVLNKKIDYDKSYFKTPLLVYILTIKLYKDIDRYHSTAVIKYNDKFYYIDPYKESYIFLENIKDLKNYYYGICSIEMFSMKETNTFCVFNAEEMLITKLLNHEANT